GARGGGGGGGGGGPAGARALGAARDDGAGRAAALAPALRPPDRAHAPDPRPFAGARYAAGRRSPLLRAAVQGDRGCSAGRAVSWLSAPGLACAPADVPASGDGGGG